jgi:myo-inositol-1(or 4)-monophosphatase
MKTELKIAIDAAHQAGDLVLKFYKSSYEVRNKGYHNPVTTADNASDNFLKESLTNKFPDYGWLSEETVDTSDRLNKQRVWVVDPLDGTKEFIAGVAHFVVSVALVEENEPILGVLYNPVSKETFSAARGLGATLNGHTIRCSEVAISKDMIILNSRSETRYGLWNKYQSAFKELRAIGSVAYKIGLIAAGKADIFASLRPKNEWDICAGHCIVREAGGDLLTLKGETIKYNQKKTIIKPGLYAGANSVLDLLFDIFNA